MPGIEAAIGLYEEAVATGFFKNVVEDDLSRSVAVIEFRVCGINFTCVF
jgi:hypothetical protein